MSLLRFTETLSIENKRIEPDSLFWDWTMVSAMAALYNSGGGRLRAGVDSDGLAKGVKNPGDYNPDGGALANTLHHYLEPVPVFESKETENYVEVFVREGVTTPVILRTDLVHPRDGRRYQRGTILVRRVNDGGFSSEPPKTRSDWQTVLHLWETNRGVTVQGQIIVQFSVVLNEWNPFQTDNTTHSQWRANCLADAGAVLGRPKLHTGLKRIVELMKPIELPSRVYGDLSQLGADKKQPLVHALQALCVELGLSPEIDRGVERSET